VKIKSNNLILKHMALGLGLLCISTRYYVICMQIFSFSFKDNCTFKGLGTYSLKVCCYNKVQVKGLIKFPSLVFAFCKVLVCFFFSLNKLVFQGESIIGPPKNCNHKYNVFTINFFGNIWTSNIGFFLLVLNIFD
jgi:hypothetical protein